MDTKPRFETCISEKVMPNCPVCQEAAVLDLGGSMTLLAISPFIGNDNKIHLHDLNRYDGDFVCPNQHQFRTTTGYQCSCGWKSNYI